MDYDPNDYYSSSGDEAAPVPTAGVEKNNKETKKPAKRAMTEAKLAQLKRVVRRRHVSEQNVCL